jgi:hypothetical protein
VIGSTALERNGALSQRASHRVLKMQLTEPTLLERGIYQQITAFDSKFCF